jgi:hypothetical protein
MLQTDCERMTLDMTNLQTERAQWKQFEAEQLQIAHERLNSCTHSHTHTLSLPPLSLFFSDAHTHISTYKQYIKDVYLYGAGHWRCLGIALESWRQ